MQNKLTKVICTIGPATENKSDIHKLYLAGMNVARFNFKHGEYPWFEGVIKSIREISKEHDAPIAILQDLQGPDIRTGKLKDGNPVKLLADEPFFLTSKKIVGDVSGVSVSLSKLNQFLNEGDHVLIDDGVIDLLVNSVDEVTAHCVVVNGGKLGERKGINIPGKRPKIKALTAKDKRDLEFGLAQKIDFVALSFVQSAEDVISLKKLLKKIDPEHAEHVQVISKVESVAGIENFDEILEASDGIMIARGDLGIELPMEQIPAIQKELIQKCNRVGKPVITATQLLDSMQNNPIPTRAEASDVANAVIDNADAVMLSAESANGKYPVQAAYTMSKIIKYTEEMIRSGRLAQHLIEPPVENTRQAVAKSAVSLAESIDAKFIVALTTQGKSAHDIARFRPGMPIIAATPFEYIHRQLLLVNSILPHCIYIKPHKNFKAMLDDTIEQLKQRKHLKKGDRIVVTAGITGADEPGHTNLAMVHEVE